MAIINIKLSKRTVTGALIALLCVSASSISAQELPAVTVHVSNVTPSASPDAEEQKIAQAINSMLELRLNTVRGVQVVRGEAKCEEVADNPPFQVKSSLKAQTSTSALTVKIVELVLEYDLVKLMREEDPQKKGTCKEVSLVHRSEPISLKTAFAAIVRMSNLLKVAVEEASAPKKTVVDVVALTGAFPQVKDQLGNAILRKLAGQEDLQVRSFGDKGGADSDYVVTGEVNTQGASFSVRNVKSNKFYTLSVPASLGQPTPVDLSEFFETAATQVVNKIREDQDPSSADVARSLNNLKDLLLCKQDASRDCVVPASVIPDLLRLKDSKRVAQDLSLAPQILSLLGDAYANQEDYKKAVQAYDEAVERSGDKGTKDTLWFRLRSAEASYKAQQYAGAAERYVRLIELAPSIDNDFLTPSLFLQAARSYRFANEPIKALDRTLQGLTTFATPSVELDKELTEILENLPGETLYSAYEILLKYGNVKKVASKLAEVKDTLLAGWAAGAIELVLAGKVQEADKYLRLIESVPVESLDKETEMFYRIARAVWRRDVRNDFAGAISFLEPYIKEQTELGVIAQYLLAETLYRRAKFSSSPDKADYVRASTLLRKITEKVPDDMVLHLLLKSNHELGKDDESRQLLEQMRGRQGATDNALFGLVVLCVDFIGDLTCGDRALKELGESARTDRELLLRFAGIQIFWAQYNVADSLLASVNPDSERPYLEVELFYRVWTQLALSRPEQAQAFFNSWRTKMDSSRREARRTDWVFTTTSRALESDQALTAANKEILKQMIAAMTDPQQPLPPANFRVDNKAGPDR